MMSGRRCAFILGSGASCPLGMPSTGDLTELVLSGDGVAGHSDTNFYFAPFPAVGHEDDVGRVCGFLRIIQEHTREFYQLDNLSRDGSLASQSNNRPNYEDLAYIISQIHDSDAGEYENPVVPSFVERIKPIVESQGLCAQRTDPVSSEWSFHKLVENTMNYIVCVVWNELCRCERRAPEEQYWKKILPVEIYELDIYTLNHDCLIENFLENEGIPITLGFGDPVNGVRYWEPRLLDSCEISTRILKLHGSTNWFQFPSPDTSEEWSLSGIGIPLNGDDQHSKDRRGEMLSADPPRPLFVVGTFNKMLTYTSGIFAQLYARFTLDLEKADHLVVVGYGFGDKGINSRILDWVWEKRSRRLIVVDPHPDNLKRHGRGAFKRSWEGLQNSKPRKKIVFLDRCAQAITWEEIEMHF